MASNACRESYCNMFKVNKLCVAGGTSKLLKGKPLSVRGYRLHWTGRKRLVPLNKYFLSFSKQYKST